LLEDAKRRIQDVVKRERTVRERERGVERQSRQEARKYLLNARAEIDRTLRDLKKAGAEELEEKAREARRHAETLAARQADVLQQLDAEEEKQRRRSEPRRAASDTVAVGDLVRVETLGGKTGRVIDTRGSEIQVAVGSLKLMVPGNRVTRLAPEEAEVAVAWHGDLPDVHVRTEIDLRGMRPDEMEAVLLQALDEAIRADMPSLRIIHGKGTGALRDRVAEMLKKDTRVKSFRLGAWNEGGAGVTIADLG
jgi:DNA mismatch repair protein MutS2